MPHHSCDSVSKNVSRGGFGEAEALACHVGSYRAALPQLAQERIGAADPNAVAFALEGRCMDVLGQDFPHFCPGQIGLVPSQIKFGKLDFGAWVSVVFGDLLPEAQGSVRFSQRGQRLGQGHERIAVVVFRIFGDDAFEKGTRLGRLFLAQKTLAEMGAGIDVLRVAFQSGAVTGFGLFEFALLKINVAELEVVVRLVQMKNLGLKLLDAAAVMGAGQFESAGGRGCGAINCEIVEQGGDAPADKNEEGPKPFAAADGIDQHPELEQGNER